MNFALRIWTGSLADLGIAVKERDFKAGIGFLHVWIKPSLF
jgi:hypothetical protein